MIPSLTGLEDSLKPPDDLDLGDEDALNRWLLRNADPYSTALEDTFVGSARQLEERIQRDRRVVGGRAQELGTDSARQVEDLLGDFPGVSPDVLASLVAGSDLPDKQTIIDILNLDAEVSLEEIALSEAEFTSPTHSTTGEAAFAVGRFLKGAIRNTLIAAAVPQEYLMGTTRNVVQNIRDGNWLGAANDVMGIISPNQIAQNVFFSDENDDDVNPWEQTTARYAWFGNDRQREQGRGFFLPEGLPSEDTAIRAQQAASTEAAPAGKGDVGWTWGRGTTDLLGWNPDDTRYKFVSGLIDFGAALLYDPLIALGTIGKAKYAAKVTEWVGEVSELNRAATAASAAGRSAAKEIPLTEIQNKVRDAQKLAKGMPRLDKGLRDIYVQGFRELAEVVDQRLIEQARRFDGYRDLKGLDELNAAKAEDAHLATQLLSARDELRQLQGRFADDIPQEFVGKAYETVDGGRWLPTLANGLWDAQPGTNNLGTRLSDQVRFVSQDEAAAISRVTSDFYDGENLVGIAGDGSRRIITPRTEPVKGLVPIHVNFDDALAAPIIGNTIKSVTDSPGAPLRLDAEEVNEAGRKLAEFAEEAKLGAVIIDGKRGRARDLFDNPAAVWIGVGADGQPALWRFPRFFKNAAEQGQSIAAYRRRLQRKFPNKGDVVRFGKDTWYKTKHGWEDASGNLIAPSEGDMTGARASLADQPLEADEEIFGWVPAELVEQAKANLNQGAGDLTTPEYQVTGMDVGRFIDFLEVNVGSELVARYATPNGWDVGRMLKENPDLEMPFVASGGKITQKLIPDQDTPAPGKVLLMLRNGEWTQSERVTEVTNGAGVMQREKLRVRYVNGSFVDEGPEGWRGPDDAERYWVDDADVVAVEQELSRGIIPWDRLSSVPSVNSRPVDLVIAREAGGAESLVQQVMGGPATRVQSIIEQPDVSTQGLFRISATRSDGRRARFPTKQQAAAGDVQVGDGQYVDVPYDRAEEIKARVSLAQAYGDPSDYANTRYGLDEVYEQVDTWTISRLDDNGHVIPGSTETIPARVGGQQLDALLREPLDVQAAKGEPLPETIISIAGDEVIDRKTQNALTKFIKEQGGAVKNLRLTSKSTWADAIDQLRRVPGGTAQLKYFLQQRGVLAVTRLGADLDITWVVQASSGASAQLPEAGRAMVMPALARDTEEQLRGLQQSVARIAAAKDSRARHVQELTEHINDARKVVLEQQAARQGLQVEDLPEAKYADALERIAAKVEDGKDIDQDDLKALQGAMRLLFLPPWDDGAVNKVNVEQVTELLKGPKGMLNRPQRALDKLMRRMGPEGLIPAIADIDNIAVLNHAFKGSVDKSILVRMAQTTDHDEIANLLASQLAGNEDIAIALTKSSRRRMMQNSTPPPVMARLARLMERRPRESVWIDARRPEAGAEQLRNYLLTIGMTRDKVNNLVRDWMMKDTAIERVDSLMDTVAVGIRDNIIHAMGGEVTNVNSREWKIATAATRLFRGGEFHRERKDWARYLNDGYAPVGGPMADGKEVPLLSPHLFVELRDTGALLPSTRMIRRLHTRLGRAMYKLDKEGALDNLSKTEIDKTLLGHATDFIDQLNNFWRFAILGRAAYLFRTLGEGFYRSFFHGAHSFFTHPLQTMSIALALGKNVVSQKTAAALAPARRWDQLNRVLSIEDLYKVRKGEELENYLNEQGRFVEGVNDTYVNLIVASAAPNDNRHFLNALAGNQNKTVVTKLDGERWELAHARALMLLSMDPMARLVATPYRVIQDYHPNISEAEWVDMVPKAKEDMLLNIILDPKNEEYAEVLEMRRQAASPKEKPGWHDKEWLRGYLWKFEKPQRPQPEDAKYSDSSSGSVLRRVEEATGGNRDLLNFVGDKYHVLRHEDTGLAFEASVNAALRKAALVEGGPIRTRKRNEALGELDKELAAHIKATGMLDDVPETSDFVYLEDVQPEKTVGKIEEFSNWFFSFTGDTEKITNWGPEFQITFVNEGLARLKTLHPEDALAWLDKVEPHIPKFRKHVKTPDLKKLRRELEAERDRLEGLATGADRRINPERFEGTIGFFPKDLADEVEGALESGAFQVLDEGTKIVRQPIDRATGLLGEAEETRLFLGPQPGMIGIRKTDDGYELVKETITDEYVDAWYAKDKASGYMSEEELSAKVGELASRHIQELFYHSLQTNNFFHAVRLAMPFGAPTASGYRSLQKSLMHWTNMTTRHYPVMKGLEAGRSEDTAVVQDVIELIEPGQDFPTMDGDGNPVNQPLLWQPYEGAPMRVMVPLVGSLLGGMTDKLGLTQGAVDQNMSIGLPNLNFFHPSARSVPPGVSGAEATASQAVQLIPSAGPFAQLLQMHTPTISEWGSWGRLINDWAHPYGRPKDVGEWGFANMPTWARYAMSAINSDGTLAREWRARDERGLLSYHATRDTQTDWTSPAGQEELMDRVNRDAAVLSFIRSMAAFWMVSVPRYEYSAFAENANSTVLLPQIMISDEWRQIREQQPNYDMAVAEFMDRFGEDLAPLLVPSTTSLAPGGRTLSIQALDAINQNEDLEAYKPVLPYFFPGDRDWITRDYAYRVRDVRSLTSEERITQAANYVKDYQKARLQSRAISGGWSDSRIEAEEKELDERWQGVLRPTASFVTNEQRLDLVRRALKDVEELRSSPIGVASQKAFERLDYWEERTEYGLSAESSAEERQRFQAELGDIFKPVPGGYEMYRLFWSATS